MRNNNGLTTKTIRGFSHTSADVWLKPLIVLVVSPLLFRMPDSWKTGGR